MPADLEITSGKVKDTRPSKWLTFCVEGSQDALEAFLGAEGKVLVPLLSHPQNLHMSYPNFIFSVSAESC